MMCLETDQRTGISIGMSISTIETYPGNYSIKNFMYISSRPHPSPVFLNNFTVLSKLLGRYKLLRLYTEAEYLIGQRIRNPWRFATEDQECKCVSRYMHIAAQVIILLKAKSAVTSVEKGIIHAENATLAGHNKWKKPMSGIIASSRWMTIFSQSLLIFIGLMLPGWRSSF